MITICHDLGLTKLARHRDEISGFFSFANLLSCLVSYLCPVSIEDAHRHNDNSLFDKFKKTTLILGVVTIANSRMEAVEDIQKRVAEVLKHIPAERLVLAPDCGLGFLPKAILNQKLANMVAAAQLF